MQVVGFQFRLAQVGLSQGQAGGSQACLQGTVPGDIQGQRGTVGNIGSRFDEGEQVARIVETQAQAVLLAGPGIIAAARQGRQFAAECQFLDILDKGGDRLGTGETAVHEICVQDHAFEVLVRMGRKGNVPDLMSSARVFQDQVGNVQVAQEVHIVSPHVVGRDLGRHFRCPAFIQLQGVQVGVAQVGVEFIHRVPAGRGEAGGSLEEEIQVGVVADQFAVERIVGIGAVGGDARIGVAQCRQPIDLEGIDAGADVAFPQNGVEGGAHRTGAQGGNAQDASQIQFIGPDRAAQRERMPFVHQVADIGIGRERSGGGLDGSLNPQAVHRSVGSSGERQVHPARPFAQIQVRGRGEAFQETADPVGGEPQGTGLDVQHHALGVRNPHQDYIGRSFYSRMHFMENGIFDVQVVDIAVHVGILQVDQQVHVFQGRGEVGDASEAHHTRFYDTPQAYLGDKVVEGGGVLIGHGIQGEFDTGPQVGHLHVADQRLSVSDLGPPRHRQDVIAALFQDIQFIGRAGNVTPAHAEVASFYVDETVHVVPINAVGLREGLSPGNIPGGSLEIHHHIVEVLQLHVADVEGLSFFFFFGCFGLLARGQAKDTGEVVVSRLQGQGEHAVADVCPVQIDAVGIQEAAERKSGHDGSGMEEGVHGGKSSVGVDVRMFVQDRHILGHQGVEGFQFQGLEGNGSVHFLFQFLHRFPGDVGLERGDLHRNQQGGDQNQQQGQQETEYLQGRIHLIYKNNNFLLIFVP